MNNRILLLEDDISLVDGLVYSLQKNGFVPEAVGTVKEAYERLRSDHYDLLLLDITLPDGTGFDVCQYARSHGNTVPIIFLTALDEEVNIIRGLDGGGDDYITKPFKLGELCSRIRALLRRSGVGFDSGSRLCSGPAAVELASNKAFLNGQVLDLTGAEYRLLCLFLKNAGRTLPRSVILDELWDGNGNFVDDNTLSVYIRRLREKIEEDPSDPKYLITVRGLGYQWREAQK